LRKWSEPFYDIFEKGRYVLHHLQEEAAVAVAKKASFYLNGLIPLMPERWIKDIIIIVEKVRLKSALEFSQT